MSSVGGPGCHPTRRWQIEVFDSAQDRAGAGPRRLLFGFGLLGAMPDFAERAVLMVVQGKSSMAEGWLARSADHLGLNCQQTANAGSPEAKVGTLSVSDVCLVALSTCDTGKWLTILKWLDSKPQAACDQHISSSNYERRDSIGQQVLGGLRSQERPRQVQRRLTREQVELMCKIYRGGASARALSQEFGIDRRTVAIRLKKAGVVMRQTRPLKNSEPPRSSKSHASD